MSILLLFAPLLKSLPLGEGAPKGRMRVKPISICKK